MNDKPPNLLETAPIRRQVDQRLTAFILEHADVLHGRRIAGERAEDILPLVVQMLGRPIKLVTFSSLLSRHVPLAAKAKQKRSTLTFQPPREQQSKTVLAHEQRSRAREPPTSGPVDTGRPSAAGHSEQPGISRPIKSKLFLPK